jgi:uncharacterized glyoxalase superfamily protein PhnB
LNAIERCGPLARRGGAVAAPVGPDRKIMHAELRIGNSIFMLNDAMGGSRSL